jgi:putative ABC transport system ATP-binding protein
MSMTDATRTQPSDGMPAADAAVRVRGVTKEFGTGGSLTRALRGVDLDVPYGELLILAGPSGCGKTTLVSIVAGTLEPSDGEVVVLGKDLVAMSNGRKVKFRRENVGFVFQSYNLLPSLTAAENAAVPLVASGTPWPTALQKAGALLDKLGLGNHINKLPRQLSGGQQQRVAIARALVHEPRLLLCDEPTAALDGKSGQAVMGLLRDLAVHPDRAAIVVTHDPRVYAYADRVAHMEDGLLLKVEEGKSAALAGTH